MWIIFKRFEMYLYFKKFAKMFGFSDEVVDYVEDEIIFLKVQYEIR